VKLEIQIWMGLVEIRPQIQAQIQPKLATVYSPNSVHFVKLLGNATGYPSLFAGFSRVLMYKLIALCSELIAKKKLCKLVKK
jgi:hypothetical protein